MNLTAWAPGKLIIIGEYAVLEGAPALVMAVDRYAEIRITDSPEETFILHSGVVSETNIRFEIDPQGKAHFLTSLSDDDEKKLLFFCGVLEKFLQSGQIPGKIHPLEFTLDTSDFYLKPGGEKLGLGSSAALTAGLVAGLMHATRRTAEEQVDPAALFDMAQSIHHAVQGKRGSGIDIASSSYGGIIEFRRLADNKSNEVEIIQREMPKDLIILTIWSGTSASTPQMVEQVRRFKQSHKSAYEQLISRLHNISSLGCRAFAAQDSTSFIQYINEYFDELVELGERAGTDIISGVHRKIAQLVQDGGAVYKPSGAGGGDIGIALTCSKTIAGQVSENILRSGFQLINLVPSSRGVYLESERIK